jgi:hypothetical protein
VAGRSVWSDPSVQELARSFVPVADEVWRMKRKRDVEGDFFRRFCELGHYRGGDDTNNTRQGIYAVTSAGHLLGSTNSRDSSEVAVVLTQALEAWRAVPDSERRLEADPQSLAGLVERLESKYPEDGLVLRSYSRDLPRDDAPTDWRKDAWNQDFAWFTKDEALALATPGSSRAAILSRFIRTSLLDNVRGQTEAYEPGDVTESLMHFECVLEEESKRYIDITGSFRNDRPVEPAYEDIPEEPLRGTDGKILGSAIFDTKLERFTAFEMIALGIRWGGTRFNGRHDDPGPSPIGWLFTLAGDSAADRIAPAHLWDAYDW